MRSLLTVTFLFSFCGLSLFSPSTANAQDLSFIRGDTNFSTQVDLTDAVVIYQYIFSFGRGIVCEDAADADDNGVIDIADAVFILAYLYSGGPVPESPFPTLGPDPTADPLDCLGSTTVQANITTHIGAGVTPCQVWLDAYNSVVSAGSILHTAKCTWTVLSSGALVTQRTGASLSLLIETPGSYLVQLQVIDQLGGIGFAQSTFEVLPFTGQTITCGSGGDHATFGNALNALRTQIQSTGVVQRRLLFKAGETFVTPGGQGNLSNIAEGSLIHIGRYGAGANPIIQVTGSNSSAFALNYAANGVRLVDLDIRGPHLDGQGDLGNSSSLGLHIAQNGGNDFSCIRTSIKNFYNCCVYAGHEVGGTYNFDRSFFGCNFDRAGRYPLFASGERFSLVDCFIGRGWGPADWYGISRHSRIRKGYFYDSTWDPSGGVSTAAYLASFDYDSQGYTEKVWISNNTFRAYLVLGRSGGHLPGLPRDVVIQRNVFDRVFPTNHSSSVMVSGSEVTIRNNVFLYPESLSSCGVISVSKDTILDGTNPSRNPTNIWIYNNSANRSSYTGTSLSYGRFLYIGGNLPLEVEHVYTHNNIWRDTSGTEEGSSGFCYTYAPWAASTFLHSDRNLVKNGGGFPMNHWASLNGMPMSLMLFRTQTGEDDNSLVAIEPGYASVDLDDLTIDASSPAAGAGAAVPGLYEDFFGVERSNPPSAGAFEP
ncbi:MAG: dockerin type I repeat-containing protein [Planctomycetota bacterium]